MSSGSPLLLNTPTNCCFGFLKLRVGIQLVAVIFIFDGACSVALFVNDCIDGGQTFRWGPRSYERILQGMSAAVGFLCIVFGLAGLRCTGSLKLRSISRFCRFAKARVMWNCFWFLLVGLPVEIVYTSVPSIDVWPFSVAPGAPMREIVDPRFPNGKPSVCVDIADLKKDLGFRVYAYRKKQWLRLLLQRVYTNLAKKFIRCQTVMWLFWGSMVATVSLGTYFVWAIEYFYKVVQHGGNGETMIGSIDDLDLPIADGMGTKALMRQRIKDVFNAMDADKDGRLSAEELIEYLERHEQTFQEVQDVQD
mmetsp:Transcript_127148/g.283446  ORF Transcript_127148/g.283446 Transcript_127148/m.283446 type:complete len:307 (-) Transcript_127148:138-1058(-)